MKVNELFDTIIEKTKLESEIKNLIIYKKGLYNADTSNENELLQYNCNCLALTKYLE